MKPCPFCKEEIQDRANVCKHCGRDLGAAAGLTRSGFHVLGAGCGLAILIVACVVGLIVMAVFFGWFSVLLSPPSVPPQQTVSPQHPPATSPDELRIALTQVLGPTTRDLPKVTRVVLGNGMLAIQWTLDDHFTQAMRTTVAKNDAKRILNTVRQSAIAYETVGLSGTFPSVDRFGNSREQPAIEITFSRDTLDQINWQSISISAIYDAADVARVDPAFQSPKRHHG